MSGQLAGAVVGKGPDRLNNDIDLGGGPSVPAGDREAAQRDQKAPPARMTPAREIEGIVANRNLTPPDRL